MVTIATDIDGVLADVITPTIAAINKHFALGTYFTVDDVTSYDLPTALAGKASAVGIGVEQLREFAWAACWDEPAFMAKLPPYRVAIDLLRYKEQGATCTDSGQAFLLFATARHEHLREVTAQWLSRWLKLPVHACQLHMDCAGSTRLTVLIEHQPIEYTDDNWDFLEHAAATLPKMVCMAPCRPWNRQRLMRRPVH